MLFEIGKEIRSGRKRRKLSQADLAKLLRMSRTTISQIENVIDLRVAGDVVEINFTRLDPAGVEG